MALINDRVSIYLYDRFLNYGSINLRIEMLEHQPSLAPFRQSWISWASDEILLISTREAYTQRMKNHLYLCLYSLVEDNSKESAISVARGYKIQ